MAAAPPALLLSARYLPARGGFSAALSALSCVVGEEFDMTEKDGAKHNATVAPADVPREQPRRTAFQADRTQNQPSAALCYRLWRRIHRARARGPLRSMGKRSRHLCVTAARDRGMVRSLEEVRLFPGRGDRARRVIA